MHFTLFDKHINSEQTRDKNALLFYNTSLVECGLNNYWKSKIILYIIIHGVQNKLDIYSKPRPAL